MKTAIEQVREALESAHHHFQNILDYGVAQGSDRDKVRAEQDILRAALTALKSLDGQGWISVKDRLPDNDRNVIVFTKYKYRGVGCLVAGYWYLSIAPETDQEEGVITHWQELPAPPTTQDPT